MSFTEYAGRYVGCNPQSVGQEAERHIAELEKRIAELEAALHSADIRLEQLGDTVLNPVRMLIEEALRGRNA